MHPLRRYEALRSMRDFARAVRWGKPSYQPSWYTDVICDHLDLALRSARGLPGGLDAVAIFMPPRHGKTLHCSELLPAYAFALEPSLEVISLTYSTDYAKDARKAVAEVMGLPTYRQICATRVGSGEAEEVDDRGRVRTRRVQEELSANVLRTLRESAGGQTEKARGLYLASSLAGKCTGKGANLFVFDDLVKNAEEANSPTARRKVEAEIEQTAFTREYRNSAQVLLMTRWHELDAGAFILRKWSEAGLRYAVLTFRAQREADDFDFDPRAEGTFLDEERFGAEFYRRRRALVGEWAWSALYQQRPASKGGKPFPRSAWARFDPALLGRRDLSILEGVALSVDGNLTEGGSSYAQIDVWGLVALPPAQVGARGRKEAWKLDEARGKWSYPDFRGNLRAMVQKWKRADLRWCLIENKVGGASLAADLEEELAEAGIEVVRVATGSLSKETRAALAAHLFDAGLVALPAGEWGPVGTGWVEEHLTEWADFPQGKNDDRVDTGVQFLRWAADHQGLVDRA